VLAAAARLERSRGVGTPAPAAAGRAAGLRAARLVKGGRRQLARQGQRGGAKTGPSPVDRRRAGSKQHLICEGQGIPLAVTLTAANRNDVTELIPLVDRVPPTGRHGKFRLKTLLGDRAYDSRHHRRALRERGITPRIAKRGAGHGSGLGKDRWVIERTFSWLHANRRLDRRYDRRDDIHEAFLTIGCALICHRHLQNSFC
jgi:transposase